MIRINSIEFSLSCEDSGEVDVKACLEVAGINIKGIAIEIDNARLLDDNGSFNFTVYNKDNRFTYRLKEGKTRPDFITVEADLWHEGGVE